MKKTAILTLYYKGKNPMEIPLDDVQLINIEFYERNYEASVSIPLGKPAK